MASGSGVLGYRSVGMGWERPAAGSCGRFFAAHICMRGGGGVSSRLLPTCDDLLLLCRCCSSLTYPRLHYPVAAPCPLQTMGTRAVPFTQQTLMEVGRSLAATFCDYYKIR
jgi:hypothetical protein